MIIDRIFGCCRARLVGALGILALCVPAYRAQDVSLTVHSDGSGNFTSVQAALDYCAPGVHPDLGRVTLLLRGLFFESVEVYSNFSAGVTLIGTGEGPLDALIINNRPGTLYSWLSATVKVDSDDFFARNVAFANNASNYNHTAAGQSLALYLAADRAALDGCALLGGQDTLCAWPHCWLEPCGLRMTVRRPRPLCRHGHGPRVAPRLLRQRLRRLHLRRGLGRPRRLQRHDHGPRDGAARQRLDGVPLPQLLCRAGG